MNKRATRLISRGSRAENRKRENCRANNSRMSLGICQQLYTRAPPSIAFCVSRPSGKKWMVPRRQYVLSLSACRHRRRQEKEEEIETAAAAAEATKKTTCWVTSPPLSPSETMWRSPVCSSGSIDGKEEGRKEGGREAGKEGRDKRRKRNLSLHFKTRRGPR